MTAAAVPSHRLKRAKRALRRLVLERRDGLLPSERAERSRRIADRVLALPEVAVARTVMAFWSFGSEVDTAPLIRALHDAGRRVVLPRVEGADILTVVFAPDDPVEPAAFGAMEPSGGVVVEASEMDVVIVPAVALDRSCRRIGYGGGFYDRFLPRIRPDALGVAIGFAVQLVDEVPQGRADRRVDAIVTEEEEIRCRKA